MDAGGRRVTRRRSVLAGVSLVLACSTIVVATIAVWAHQVAFNTDRFTALASNALEQPEVIDPLAARISAQVVTTLDVQSRLTNVLPDRVTAIAGPVTLALQDGLTRRLQTLLAEPRMQQALTRTLSFAHTQGDEPAPRPGGCGDRRERPGRARGLPGRCSSRSRNCRPQGSSAPRSSFPIPRRRSRPASSGGSSRTGSA